MRTIETPRLILRNWRANDAYDLFDIMKSSSVIMGGWEPHSDINISVKVLSEYIDNDEKLAIELKESKKAIGCINVYPDNNRGKLNAKSISYVLSDDYCGNGYMTEAVKRIIKYLFEETETELLSAFHYPDNNKSKKILESCGFEYELIIEQGSKRYDGQTFDSVCYSILKNDYNI